MNNNQNKKNHQEEPLIPASTKLPELTFKAILLGILLALVLSASNIYLALKIGTTISASIPASVLALGFLKMFKKSNVLETNIAQTAASAGEGVAAAAAFFLPALIVLHAWTAFPYWETTTIIGLSGLMGVLFSIPLRRILLSLPNLRFPEGTAIGNVLRASVESDNGSGFKQMIAGGIGGALFAFMQTGLKIAKDTLSLWTFSGKSIVGLSFGLIPSALAAGYIIGIDVGVTLMVGLILGWIVILPLLGLYYGVPHNLSAYGAAMSLWTHRLRFIGVGTMLVGGIWTLLRLTKPVVRGLQESFRSIKTHGLTAHHHVERTEKDVPLIWVIVGLIAISILFYLFIAHFTLTELSGLQTTSYLIFVVTITVLYVLVIGFLLSTICGYFTGLVGSSNNPLSGIMIIAILLLAGLYLLLFGSSISEGELKIASVVILVTTAVACTASISNENIQDLKAGQMIGATPWKQQVMLGIGVLTSALIAGPVLNLLLNAYGLAGVFPHPGMDPSQMLGAPQASLMAVITEGILTRNLPWGMIFIGVLIAIVIIAIDAFLRRHTRHTLPALAVGLAIYLPPEIMSPVVIGAFVSYFVKRRLQKRLSQSSDKDLAAKQNDASYQNSILLACGMVAGSALVGVILAIPFVISGNANVLSILPANFKEIADIIGVGVFIAFCYWFYRVGSSVSSLQSEK